MASGAPQKVFVDLAPLAPDGSNGGAAVLVLRLLRALLARPDAHEYHLLVKPAAASAVSGLIGTGAILHRVGPGLDVEEPRRLRREMRRLPDLLARVLPDAASLTTCGAGILFSPLGSAAFHEPRLPHVAVAHDFQELSHPEFFDERELRRRQEFRADLLRCDRVVAISETTKRDGVGRVGIREERVTVAPPVAGPVRTPLAHAKLSRILDSFGLLPGSFIFYPANFWPHKNHERLLAALARARQERSEIRLVLCGALDAARERLLASVSARGLGDAVRVFPYLGEDEVTALFQGALFLVFPSLFEGFGIPVLEAMTLGMPVACSDLPALRELAGEDAVFFNPWDETSIADALLHLCDRGDARKQLIEAGRARAESYADLDVVGTYHRLLSP